jgi:hypothetical protein
MTDRQRFYGVLGQTFFPLLRSQGFKGSGSTFRCLTGEVIAVLNLQGSTKPWEAGTFCVNLGVHLTFLPTMANTPADPKKIKETDCEFWTRLAPKGETDHWWNYGRNGEETARAAREMVNTYQSEGVAFFEHYPAFPGPFAAITPEQLEAKDYSSLPGWRSLVRSALVMGQINVHLGRLELAKRFARLALANLGPATALKKPLQRILKAT